MWLLRNFYEKSNTRFFNHKISQISSLLSLFSFSFFSDELFSIGKKIKYRLAGKTASPFQNQ